MGASLRPGRRDRSAARSGRPEQIVPYVRQPEEIVPGKPLYFATAMPLGGYAIGAAGREPQGRPTKVEGNPDHPGQPRRRPTRLLAGVDPGASTTPTARRSSLHRGADQHLGRVPRTALDATVRQRRAGDRARAPRPDRDRHLADARRPAPTRSCRTFPEAQWHQYEPVGRDNARAGARLAFGETSTPRYRLRPGRRGPGARRRLPRLRPGHRPLRRATSPTAPRVRQPHGRPGDEPALRRRDRRRPSPGRRPTTALPLPAGRGRGVRPRRRAAARRAASAPRATTRPPTAAPQLGSTPLAARPRSDQRRPVPGPRRRRAAARRPRPRRTR